MTVTAEQLAECKTYLDITWADDDAKLTGAIQRGCAYIAEKTGITSVFDSDRAKELLFCYLLYDRAGSLDAFKKNYQSDIVGLAINTEVGRYANTASTES